MTLARLSPSLPLLVLACAAAAAGLRAQDPPKKGGTPEKAPTQAPARSGPAPQAPGRRSRPRRALTALRVGTIHPVEGAAIQDGVILINNGRILAVGPASKLKIPRGAKVVSHPKAHAYPGLVDALTTAYAPAAELANRGVNAGSDFADALDPTDEDAKSLVEAGITTAYVANRGSATWRGLGAVIRPQQRSFGQLRGTRHGGLSLRLTSGTRKQHPLTRLKLFDKTGNVFDGLEAYEKKKKDYQEALTKYRKDYKAWLASHKKPGKGRKARRPAGKAATGKNPAGKTPGGKPAGKAPSGKAPAGKTPTAKAPAAKPAAKQPVSSKPKRSGKASKKPKYPKPFRDDPAKEALLKVADGKLPLRIEAHRVDEIRAALFLAFDKELPSVVLEHCSEAGKMAEELAQGGAPVVLCDLLPGRSEYDEKRDASLPARLHKAGVSFCIASGNANKAPNLALMAAYACGHGLDERAAIEAITLAPARVLGIDDKVGSLKRGKFADILITSGPLLASDSKVLRVMSLGRTQYAAEGTAKK